jgi:hypothetical protein
MGWKKPGHYLDQRRISGRLLDAILLNC